MLGLKGIAIALMIGTALGGAGGWRVTKAFDDSRWFKAQVAARDATIKTLEARIRVANQAATDDQVRAAAAEKTLNETKERADALKRSLVAGQCFVGANADRVRELWNAPAGAGKARAPAGRRGPQGLLLKDGAGAGPR